MLFNGLPWKRTKIILSFLRLHPSSAFWTLLLTMRATPFLLRDSLPTVVDISSNNPYFPITKSTFLRASAQDICTGVQEASSFYPVPWLPSPLACPSILSHSGYQSLQSSVGSFPSAYINACAHLLKPFP